MNLLEKARIIKDNTKNLKKSILSIKRIDIFLIFVFLIIVCSPFIVNLISKLNADIKQVNLILSPSCEEIFGKEMTETLLRDFNEQNPDMRVQLPDFSKTGRQAEKYREPDILIFDEGEYSALVAAGAFEGYEADSPDGTAQLAIPLVSFMDLLFYNIDILTASGFDRPPKTREEFLVYSRAISKSNVSALAISLSPDDRQALSRDIFSWIWAAGNDFQFLEAEPVFNTRAMTGDIFFFGNLKDENVLAPGIHETTGQQRLEEFARGKIAMLIASTRAIPFLREKMGDDIFGITTVPVPASAGRYNISLSGIYAGINANTVNLDEARRFLAFLAEKSPLFCEMFKAVPGIVSNITPDYINDDPFYSKAYDIFESSGLSSGFYGMIGGEEYENIIREELQVFFETRRSAQETANTIQHRIENSRQYSQDLSEN